jgi:hypothetical protein
MSFNTTLELSNFLNITRSVPSLDPGESRDIEELGASDGTTRFYLNNSRILDGTYTIYYGTTSDTSLSNPLTETTHYTINKDSGYIELTADGKTEAGDDGSNNLYAEYKYVDESVRLTDTQLQDYLDKANQQIKTDINSVFVDNTLSTPDYSQTTYEIHTGKGYSNREYFLNNYPVRTFTTLLDGDVAAEDTTITVDSTDGFPDSGHITINNNKIQYTGKTDTTFTGCTNVESHDDNDTVYPYVIEVSYSGDGYSVSWQTLKPGTDYHLDSDSGRVYLYSDSLEEVSDVVYSTKPGYQLPNRFRATYLSGYNTIPEDIIRLELMIASQDIVHTVVRNTLAIGSDGFQPQLINVDKDWINQTIEKYKIYKSTNI